MPKKNAKGFPTRGPKGVLAYSFIFALPDPDPDSAPVTVPSHRAPGGAKNLWTLIFAHFQFFTQKKMPRASPTSGPKGVLLILLL